MIRLFPFPPPNPCLWPSSVIRPPFSAICRLSSVLWVYAVHPSSYFPLASLPISSYNPCIPGVRAEFRFPASASGLAIRS
ncbi:MAG: hypothetical protein COT35_14020 [Nitrospirae bacterium CG08_land_8_20_14_0_20_52_24]|nr:MAG: hypothetical protein COT35_14020 [Nitrospirae bacterium CG08_land_8_20_14_0_20_52_24]